MKALFRPNLPSPRQIATLKSTLKQQCPALNFPRNRFSTAAVTYPPLSLPLLSLPLPLPPSRAPPPLLWFASCRGRLNPLDAFLR